MKTQLFLLAFGLFSVSLLAQEETPAPQTQPVDPMREQTLFNNAKVTGGFGGPIFSYSRTDGRDMWGAGGGGGVVLNHFFIGAFGMGETFDDAFDDFNNPNEEHIGLGYGGLWMGYTWPTQQLIHLYASAKIGGGAVGSYYYDDYYDHHDGWDDVVFVAVPEVGAELNIARWFRLSASAGYRFVGGFEGYKTLDSNDFNAPTFALTMRFGWFTRK
jgi:hypothetical protein